MDGRMAGLEQSNRCTDCSAVEAALHLQLKRLHARIVLQVGLAAAEPDRSIRPTPVLHPQLRPATAPDAHGAWLHGPLLARRCVNGSGMVVVATAIR